MRAGFQTQEIPQSRTLALRKGLNCMRSTPRRPRIVITVAPAMLSGAHNGEVSGGLAPQTDTVSGAIISTMECTSSRVPVWAAIRAAFPQHSGEV